MKAFFNSHSAIMRVIGEDEIQNVFALNSDAIKSEIKRIAYIKGGYSVKNVKGLETLCSVTEFLPEIKTWFTSFGIAIPKVKWHCHTTEADEDIHIHADIYFDDPKYASLFKLIYS